MLETLSKAWIGFRNDRLRSARFRAFASGFPLTRPIVRKRQLELFDLVAGFVYSQILASCVELEIFEKLDGGCDLETLASRIGLGEDETRRLAEGACSLRLLQKTGGVYHLGDLGAALVASSGVVAMVRSHAALYADLQDPVALLRRGRGGTRLADYWAYAGNADPAAADDAQTKAYTQLMADSQIMMAEEVLAAYDFSSHRTLLDVGGGDGTFLTAVAEAAPDLSLHLFDLPAVIDRANDRFRTAGLENRATVHGGSFFDDPLPAGADVITLVRVLLDHDDGSAEALLRAAYEALPAGGKLLLCEPMSVDGPEARVGDAYFNIYLYAMGSGRPRSPQTIESMLRNTGFSAVRRIATRFPLITSIVCGERA